MDGVGMTIFNEFLNSGLPIDWTTVFIGWQGLPGHRLLITRDQVLDYAMDQIGYSLPEQESIVAELAFADAQDTWTIQRCLEQLALDAPEDVQRATRIWQWVLLNEIVTRLEKEAQAIPSRDVSFYGSWCDEFSTDVYCGIHDFWSDFAPLPEDFTFTTDWQQPCYGPGITAALKALQEQREWLVQIKASVEGER